MREEIIKMAREAGMYYREIEDEFHTSYSDGVCLEELERFFHMAQAAERSNWPAEMEAMERQVNILTDELAKAVAAEREACAKVAENCRYEHNITLTSMPPQNGTAVGIANRIRARSGEKK